MLAVWRRIQRPANDARVSPTLGQDAVGGGHPLGTLLPDPGSSPADTGTHRVISIAGLELALGQTLKGHDIPYEPLLWLIPGASLLLVALLLRTHRRTVGSRHWLAVAIIAWAAFLLLFVKAVQWLWVGPFPAPEAVWVMHWLTTWFLLTSAAFLLSGLAAARLWMGAGGPRPQPSSTSSEDTPFDEEHIQ